MKDLKFPKFDQTPRFQGITYNIDKTPNYDNVKTYLEHRSKEWLTDILITVFEDPGAI